MAFSLATPLPISKLLKLAGCNPVLVLTGKGKKTLESYQKQSLVYLII